jgi:hypothetical protein
MQPWYSFQLLNRLNKKEGSNENAAIIEIDGSI